jgi:hypothetical protein
MSSFIANIRRARSLLRARTVGGGIALALASGATLAGGAHPFVFTAYRDATGGADVVAGRYRAALAQLSPSGTMDPDPAAASTNRCVAYSMSLQWPQAHAACDAAIEAAAAARTALPAWLSWTDSSSEKYLALAYANRAVMDWLSNDAAAAREDLARAQDLAPQADFVARNVAALKVHGALAVAAAAAPKS